MEILPHDEVDPDAVVWLNRLGLGYEFPTSSLRKVRRVDPRLAKEFAWYAVEGGRPVSQVGYLLYPVRTAEGREIVGVPEAVCSLPGASGRGHARALMEHVHSRLRERGARFSFLTTSRFRGAYRLYRSLGYEDLVRIRVAYGRLRGAVVPGLHVRKAVGRDAAAFHRAFAAHTRDALGFTERPRNFVAIRTAWEDVKPGEIWTLSSRGHVVGYAWCERKNPTHVRELVATAGDPLAWARTLATGHDVSIVLSPRAAPGPYQTAGLQVAESWSVLMVKDLLARMKTQEIRVLFGVDAGRFESLAFDLW